MQDNNKHSILVLFDDVTVQHAVDTYYVSVGDQMVTLTEKQTESLFRAFDGLYAAMEG